MTCCVPTECHFLPREDFRLVESAASITPLAYFFSAVTLTPPLLYEVSVAATKPRYAADAAATACVSADSLGVGEGVGDGVGDEEGGVVLG